MTCALKYLSLLGTRFFLKPLPDLNGKRRTLFALLLHPPANEYTMHTRFECLIN